MAFLPGINTVIGDLGALVGGTTTTTTAPPPAPIQPPVPSGLSAGALAAIIGGSVLVLGIVIVLAVKK